MRFNFRGYFEIAYFEISLNSEINYDEFKYIIFSSSDAQKAIYKFYKEELQQGEGIKVDNLGKRFIAETDFYDMFPKKPSWEKFKNEFCPIVIYSFEKIDDTIWLTPLNVKTNNEVIRKEGDKVLKI